MPKERFPVKDGVQTLAMPRDSAVNFAARMVRKKFSFHYSIDEQHRPIASDGEARPSTHIHVFTFSEDIDTERRFALFKGITYTRIPTPT